MHISIHSLEKTVYEGEGAVVSLPAKDGEISVMQNHIPLVTALKQGAIRVKNEGQKTQEFSIMSGFAEVNPENVIVLLTP